MLALGVAISLPRMGGLKAVWEDELILPTTVAISLPRIGGLKAQSEKYKQYYAPHVIVAIFRCN
jgi:hypothetical protein